MKVVLPGGSGQIGTSLAREFFGRGDEVVVLSRTPQEQPWKTVIWDARTLGPWVEEINGADVVVNLVGRKVHCRYTPPHRREMLESRVDSTRVLAQAIVSVATPPSVWLQASTATIYAHRYDAANDEADGVIGGNEPGVPASWRNSVDIAQAWEAAATAFMLPKTRLVLMRSAMVMSPARGGIFDVLLRLVRVGLGGRAGSGNQYMSWIHDKDFARAIFWAIEHSELSGPVNFASPHPLTNDAFMKALRKAWGISIGLPAAHWMVELGALWMQTESELVLKSRRVVPRKLLESGFSFHYPEWPAAARNLCCAWEAVTHARDADPG